MINGGMCRTLVVGQFRVRVFITEPSAVAPDAGINLYPKFAAQVFSINSLLSDITQVDSRIRRYRARFCNDVSLHTQLSDGAFLLLFIKLTHYPSVRSEWVWSFLNSKQVNSKQ